MGLLSSSYHSEETGKKHVNDVCFHVTIHVSIIKYPFILLDIIQLLEHLSAYRV